MPVKVCPVNSMNDFKTLTTNNVVIVDFYATWCGPCKMISPKFEEMSMQSKYQNIRFDEISRMVNDMYNDSCRYTDKRIDKSLNQKEIL